MRTTRRSSFLLCFWAVAALSGVAVSARAQTEPPPAAPAAIELDQSPAPAPEAPGADEPEQPTPEQDANNDAILPPPWLNEAAPPAPRAASHPPPHRQPTLPVPPLLGGTQHGATGLLRTVAATTLSPGHLLLQFTGAVSSGSDVIVDGDRNTRLAGSVALAYGVRPGLELYGSLSGSSNRNRRESEAGRVDPEVIRAFGDIVFGGKLGRELQPGTDVAAYASARLLSSADGVFLDFAATSVALGGVMSWDLSGATRVPAHIHLNLGYFIDNSGNLQDFGGVGQASRLVAAYAYGIGRSRFQTSAALEVLAQKLGEHVLLTPFLEYHLDVITGKSDPAFAEFAPPACPDSGRRCQDNRAQQWLTLGTRAQMGADWWTTVAVDLSLSSPGFPFGPPQPAATFVLQVGRRFGAAPPPPEPAPVPEPAAEAEDGVISGSIRHEVDGSPVAAAIIAVEGRAHARVASDPDGTFTTHDLEPGSYDLVVTGNGFEPKTVQAKVSPGMVTEVDVPLAPRVQGTVRGRVVDAAGKGVAAVVRFDGAAQVVAYAQSSGLFDTSLPPGVYVVRASSEDHLTKEQRLSLDAAQVATLDFTLRPRRPVAAVDYRAGSGFALRAPITFISQAGGLPVVLHPDAPQILDEVVDLLVKQPGVRRLVIETHWDRPVGKVDAMAISEQQAHAIGDYLQAQGVAADRLELAPRGASAAVGKAPRAGARRKVVLTAVEAP